jgi:hypothetical protein
MDNVFGEKGHEMLWRRITGVAGILVGLVLASAVTAGPASAAIDFPYEPLVTTGTVTYQGTTNSGTIYNSGWLGCGTATSCSISRSTASQKCTTYTAVTGMTNTLSYAGTIAPTIPKLSLGSYQMGITYTTTNETSNSSSTCTTQTVTMTCTISAGGQVRLMQYIQYNKYRTAVRVDFYSPSIGIFHTVTDFAYTQKVKAAVTTCT